MSDEINNEGGQTERTTEVHHHNNGGGSNAWLILLVVVIIVIIAIFAFRGTTNAPDNDIIPDNVDVQIQDESGDGASGTFEADTPEAETGGANE